MRGLLPLLLLLAILASGCVREKSNPYEPDLGDDTGVARIVVQDNHNQRVFNATVLVSPGGAFGRTDASGFFMAEGLAPGSYTATVNAKGYSDARRPFQVEAGQLHEVVVHVDRL